ncbi:MAG: transcription termination factor Rho [Chloroflexi bacterium]|nr:transcription termination factor Rho [Chloroflexota bacterium]
MTNDAPRKPTTRRRTTSVTKPPSKRSAKATARPKATDAQPATPENQVTGILQLAGKGGGVLRDPTVSLQPTPADVAVPAKLIQQYKIVAGATITGTTTHGKQGAELATVETICGLSPEAYKQRTPFASLVAISPHERFNLSATNETSLRVMDLIAPIGKGTRGLVVAPPKTGKTILLEQIARAIHVGDPATRIIILLIDERPEEVTHFRRTVQAEVFASSNDQGLQEHVALVELTMAHIRAELECGRNIVVLVDSLTRMARAYNLQGTGSRRTMSGGVDAGALEIPRRFFGLARNIEKGGSITIIATALIETNSRMDDLIFQEFKGTGNSELVLDRELAEARIFPAMNLLSSSTRNEDLLYTPDEIKRLAKLRRWLASGKPKQAMNGLLKLIGQTKDNDELLRRIRLGE